MVRVLPIASFAAEFRLESNVFLSPHFDDIAFSIGELARTIKAGTIINCFTRTSYHNAGEQAGSPEARVEKVSAMRSAEDLVFAETCNLQRVDLRCEDASLRGRRPNDLSGLDDDCLQLRTKLFKALDQQLASASASVVNLFCPAAFGMHVQHRATQRVFLDWLSDKVRQKASAHIRVFFYEDLPYSSKIQNRPSGIFRLLATTSRLFPARKLHRIALLHPPESEKLALCGIYASQLKRPPSYRDFSPMSIWPRKPHEAVWSLQLQP
jgi:hypothetical protein